METNEEKTKGDLDLLSQLYVLIGLRTTVKGQENLFKQFLERNNYSISVQGMLQDNNGAPVDYTNWEHYLLLGLDSDLSELKQALRKQNPSDPDVKAALKLQGRKFNRGEAELIYQDNKNALMMEKIKYYRSKLASEGTDLGELTKFVSVLTDTPPSDEDLYAFAHSLWLVKRGLFHKPRSYEHMLCMYGAQGAGKSTALKELFSPLKGFIHYTALDKLSDSSSTVSFATAIVQICEEMAGANRQCMAKLKDVITNPNPSDRLRYAKYMSKFTNRATFFGSTNTPIAELLRDRTGMRRFYQLDVNPKLRNRWDVLNRINYKKLWRGIDERLDGGYMTGKYQAIGDKIAKKKHGHKQMDVLEVFLETLQIEALREGDKGRFVLNTAILEAFKTMLDEEGITNSVIHSIDMTRIGMSLNALNFKKQRSAKGRGWLLNDDCLIGQSDYDENIVRVVK